MNKVKSSVVNTSSNITFEAEVPPRDRMSSLKHTLDTQITVNKPRLPKVKLEKN